MGNKEETFPVPHAGSGRLSFCVFFSPRYLPVSPAIVLPGCDSHVMGGGEGDFSLSTVLSSLN
jgi:hypothetical protein